MRQEHAVNMAVVTAIDMGLSKIYGPDDAAAIKFVADPRMALGSGQAFAAVIQKMFGSDSERILKSIEDSLCEVAAVQKREWKSFEECVATVRKSLDDL